jgi:hypothetical protein
LCAALQAEYDMLELRAATNQSSRRSEHDNVGSSRPTSVDEQLVEACKTVDTATLVEIVQRFHKMQDDYDGALEQIATATRQLGQSRAECSLLSTQLGTANADMESHKRKFRLQLAITKRCEIVACCTTPSLPCCKSRSALFCSLLRYTRQQ